MKNIQNIIFDLGGVFLDVQYQLTKTAFENLGITDFDKYFMQHHSNPLFADFEKGTISNEVFFEGFRNETQTKLSNEEITFAWNAMLGNFFPEAVDWLFQIKDKYKIFLFSNTNKVHHDAFIPHFFDQYKTNLDALFLKTYYSHELHMRKPDLDGFQEILQQKNLKASETLFIDDTEINTIAAEKIGMQTIFLKKPLKVSEQGL